MMKFSWILALALVGCEPQATTCGGESGKPCGCQNDVICREPCIDCCETVPCPVEGCAR